MDSVSYEDLLREEGKVITHAVGSSMKPLLNDRESIIILEPVDCVPPRRGDVVLYRMNGLYILHRVLQVRPDEYLIRGDNTWVKEHVPKEALLATLTGFYRHPQGRLVTRGDIAYGLYRFALPCIRIIRRIGGKVKQTFFIR